ILDDDRRKAMTAIGNGRHPRRLRPIGREGQLVTLTMPKMRTLDRRSHGDQKAVRRVVAPNIGINFVAARQAPATRYLRPMAQHPIDQSPLFLHRLGPYCRVIVHASASMSGEG